ncbi:MAG: glycosyl transferase family 90 [Pseudomonadota bacterium]
MTRGFQRFSYYLKGAGRQILPRHVLRRRTQALLAAYGADPDHDELERRARYYMKLQRPFVPHGLETRSIPFKHSRYFFDFMEHALGFPKEARFDPLFGDVIHVPETPRLAKSRPLTDENANSVLFPLDKFRHFLHLNDPQPFRAKKPKAIWRGALNSPERIALIMQHAGNALHDIGHTGEAYEGIIPKPFATPKDHIDHKYLLSVEGIDVATNLKWMMGTNCLVLSPPLRFESWYMEGALEPGVHFVELASDFSDLEEKIEFYNDNPEAAETIIAAAQAWRNGFDDPRREAMVAARVLSLYLELSGQTQHDV